MRFDSAARAMFASDASNYRHVPVGVVEPASAADVVAALEVCRRHGAPVLPRGRGTSIGGQAVNAAVVLDFSRHLRAVVDIDPEGHRARVQPGVVLDELRRQAGAHGLTFGPDPSTHSRCTLGGMIGNNACGSHSVAWGKTVDNVEALDVVTYDGTRLTLGPTSESELDGRCADLGPGGRIHRELRAVRDRYGPLVAERYPDLTRRVSGYNLDQLLPEQGFDTARALVGSEGTCATLLEATVTLVESPAARALAVLGFPDAFLAADNVLPILAMSPLAMEGIDEGLVAALRAAHPDEQVSRLLPRGGGWLYVETGGSTVAEAEARAREVADVASGLGATSVVVSDQGPMRALWRIREEGAGIVTRLPDGGEAWPGWEDSAVPPAHLGSYLRELSALLAEYRLRGAYYGHFGDGCVHIRIDFDLLSDRGIASFRRFMEDAADLVVRHGGSLSGEHGDGQARAELLPRMYPPEIIDAFGAFKSAWDPSNRMNPRTIVAPRRLDDDLRVHLPTPKVGSSTRLAFAHDGGSFVRATRRCMGVGKCVADGGGVMCPSWRVTGEEQHSTRGRARLLFEMANGEVVTDGWRSTEVRDALDLCLSCKGCKRDCPVGVDMASYKAEFLSHHYAGRLRPAAHYSMGWLPLLARMASMSPRLANAVSAGPLTSSVLKRLGGIAPERQVPAIAGSSFARWFANRSRPVQPAGAPRVVLVPDTFTNFFDPAVGRAATAVLEALGYRVELPSRPVCCGLTWMSTGQLGVARRVLGMTLKTLAPWVRRGVPVVGLEPSCTTLLRADAGEILGDAADARRLAEVGAATRTFAELLAGHDGDWPESSGGPSAAIAQVHCHQYSDLGFDPDREVLGRLGVSTDVLDSGCCGLAGNFGFEVGHYDVSMACAERALLPAVRGADAGSAVLADGFSCRTQVRQATSRRPVHLAELAAQRWGLQVE